MKVGFIGGGKMGEAILAELARSGTVAACDLAVCELDEARRQALQERHHVSVALDIPTLLGMADVVFLAVKPQNLEAVLAEMSAGLSHNHLVISIAAGKSLPALESRLPPFARVIRVMPNLAVLVAEGMSVFCGGGRATAADRQQVAGLLSCLGKVLELPEHLFDAVTALSGSGPAFFAHVVRLMVDGGVRLGLTPGDAERLATQTMLGTAKLLVQGTYGSAAELIAAVSSKGGTTVAGMEVLERSGMADTVADTLKAAACRSEELSR
jgi:pyrroline-5-carboxylate reductase